jgi:enoyl-CoA hydratase
MSGCVRLERHGAVGEIVIDRPDKHNALTPRMFEELRDVCAEINNDDSVNAVVLRGVRAGGTGSTT